MPGITGMEDLGVISTKSHHEKIGSSKASTALIGKISSIAP